MGREITKYLARSEIRECFMMSQRAQAGRGRGEVAGKLVYDTLIREASSPALWLVGCESTSPLIGRGVLHIILPPDMSWDTGYTLMNMCGTTVTRRVYFVNWNLNTRNTRHHLWTHLLQGLLQGLLAGLHRHWEVVGKYFIMRIRIYEEPRAKINKDSILMFVQRNLDNLD